MADSKDIKMGTIVSLKIVASTSKDAKSDRSFLVDKTWEAFFKDNPPIPVVMHKKNID